MREDGHVQVLEAMIVTLLLLGSVFTVMTLRTPGFSGERIEAGLTSSATDALMILAGLRDENGSLLEVGFSEALHCKLDPSPSATSCTNGRGNILQSKLNSYLPGGSSTMLGLSNGAATREIWRDESPLGSATTASFALVPSWNTTFVLPTLSCSDPTVDANVTLVPIRQGNLTNASSVKVNMSNGVLATAQRSDRWGTWNTTLTAAARPASGVARADVTAKGGTFPGSAAYGSCALEGRGSDLRFAADNVSVRASSSTPVGGSVTFTTDLTPLLAVPGLALEGAGHVLVYEPLPPRGTEPDTYAPQANLTLPAGNTATISWAVPSDSLYGAHPVVLRQLARLTLPSTAIVYVEVRAVTVLEVALPDGTVPSGAPYNVVLQIWLPDWK